MWPLVVPAVALAVHQFTKLAHKPFLAGWLFGLGWFGVGISWVHVSIADFGGLPLIASLLLMALLCGYLSLFPAIAFWVTARYFPARIWPLTLPFFWVLSEWVRSWLLTGFPWLSLGYSQIDSPLSGWVPIIGETGITALIIICATALGVVRNTKQLLGAITITFLIYCSGWVASHHHWVSPKHTYNIAMVQGNIPQSLRWEPEQDTPTMNTYLNLTEPLWQQADVIIWPEAAVPKLEPLAIPYLSQVDKRAFSENTALITGIVNYNWETDNAWNNLIVLGKKSATDITSNYRYFHNNRYAKHHLLPIGEFVPFEDWLRPLAPLFDLPMSSFSRGEFKQANLIANGIHFAPAICFEIAFPRQVAANINNNTDIIITVSNDAWFGHSHGPAQHLEIARMRALEFGRPVVRATNNGITAFINEKGVITAQLPQFVAASITAPVTATTGFTPYHYIQDLGVWIIVTLLLIAGIWLVRYTQIKH